MNTCSTALMGIFLGIAIFTPMSSPAAIIEYAGSRDMDINGANRYVSLSMSIDDNFHESSQTVQHMHDNYPPTARIDQYFGNVDNESANLYDRATWWGNNPTNYLPPLLSINRLDLTNAGENSTYINLDENPILLRPIPLPTAFWLFTSGLIILVSVTSRTSLK
jgi:hypothetical protein